MVRNTEISITRCCVLTVWSASLRSRSSISARMLSSFLLRSSRNSSMRSSSSLMALVSPASSSASKRLFSALRRRRESSLMASSRVSNRPSVATSAKVGPFSINP
jgi:hypothetical protein